jgi:hypothetical protein
LLAAAVASSGLSALVLITARGDDSALGAPRYWPWLLTGLQVLALWSAGARRWWGWLLGGSVQLPWIAYALATAQLGFVPGCAVSALVQFHSFLKSSRSAPADRPRERAPAQQARPAARGGPLPAA